MAEFTHIDLKRARESRNWPQWKLAAALGVSVDTVQRWESDNGRPRPDDVGNIERELRYPGLWHRWMLSHYDSYRERYASVPDLGHPAAGIIRMIKEIEDLIPYFKELQNDSINGNFDNKLMCANFKKEAMEAIASIIQILDEMD